MKKVFGSIALIAAALIGTQASAETVDVNLGIAGISQNVSEITGQTSTSVAIAVGEVTSSSEVASTAINAVNLANLDVDVAQADDAAGLADINALASGAVQNLTQATSQAATSLAGSGSVSNGSSLTSMAANLANSATVSVRVRQ